MPAACWSSAVAPNRMDRRRRSVTDAAGSWRRRWRRSTRSRRAAATEAARAMATVTEAARPAGGRGRGREATERDERAAAAAIEAVAGCRARRGAAESRIIEELAAQAPPSPALMAARLADAALPALERGGRLRDAARQPPSERDRALGTWTTAQAAAREIEDRQLGDKRSLAVEAPRQMQAEATITSQRIAHDRRRPNAPSWTAGRPRAADAAAAEARAQRTLSGTECGRRWWPWSARWGRPAGWATWNGRRRPRPSRRPARRRPWRRWPGSASLPWTPCHSRVPTRMPTARTPKRHQPRPTPAQRGAGGGAGGAR